MIKQVCEVCYKREATCVIADKKDEDFKFCCTECQNESSYYWIDFDRFHEDDNWLRHLREKMWFSEDMEKSFMAIRSYIINNS